MPSFFSALRRAVVGSATPPHAALDLRAFVLTSAGPVRTNNEDRARCILEDLPNQDGCRVGLVMLADGMGGHQAGEIAAETTIEALARAWRNRAFGDPSSVLRAAIANANAEVFAASKTRSDWDGMGTTITALAFEGDAAYVGHVGDTRAYLFRDGALRQLTKDDTLISHLVQSGTITSAQAEKHPDYGVLAQALGTHERLRAIHLEGPVALRAGDIFLLCTDGLHDVLSDRQIEEVLRNTPLEQAANALLGGALAARTRDNISVALVGAMAVDSARATRSPAERPTRTDQP